MLYARIVDNKVAEVIDAGDKDINTMFTAELVATMVQDPDGEAVEGSGWDGSDFSDPVPYVPDINEARLIRNRHLENSDWTHVSDSQLSESKKTEWKVYRQALRDVPASHPDHTWPTEPS
jgi:hypothetical protein